MLHPPQIHALLSKGLTLIPLRAGSKKPAVKWKHLIDNPVSIEARTSMAASPGEYAVLTGPPSQVMVLDFDGPPYLTGLPYTPTPSGGRHYYFRYRDHYRHALGIDGHIDIPYIAKVYGDPEIIESEMPINGQAAKPLRHSDPVLQPDVDMEDFDACYFMRRFRVRRDEPWDNRYMVARAYASNVIHAVDPDLSLGDGYRHTEHIYQTVNRPTRCETLHQSAPCPHFVESTCSLCPGVSTPYGLARRFSLRKHRP
jgi:hypothetical protein